MIPAPLYCLSCGAANQPDHTHCFVCQQPLSAESHPNPPQTADLLHDRYQLGTCLGSGGYSLVYRASDLLAAGRTVAIKQISLHGLSAQAAIEATETFHREVRMLSLLNHPQVPHLYEHFGDQDHWYLVLDYIEGQTLETYLATREKRGQPLRLPEIIAMILQLCSVLEYLHSRQPPMIFRDLKPGNIMRTPKGVLCLIDFGIARHYQPGLARDTQRLGSPGYAAPEQYGRTQTTPQADVYSLGALLHFLLSGQEPSDRLSEARPLGLSARTAHPELEQLASRMLALDPSARPTIREVVTTLKDHRSPQGVAPLWQPSWSQSPQPQSASAASQQQIQQPLPKASSRLARRRVLIGLGLATIAIGSEVWLWRQWKQPAPMASPLPATSLTPHPTSIHQGHTAIITGVAWSPDSKYIASSSADGSIHVWNAADGSGVFTYLNHSGGVWGVAWSPEGKRIASASDDRTVRVWDAADGGNVLVYLGHTAEVSGVAWSPNGQRLASSSADATVQVWSAIDGGHLSTYVSNSALVSGVIWSPDGQRLASSNFSTDDYTNYNINYDTVRVWDAVAGGHIFTYRGHSASISEVAWSPNGKRIASASADETVQIWNAADGSLPFIYQGHSDGVVGVAWSPDNQRLASASLDGTAQVWTAIDGNLLATYTGANGAIAWSPDGQHLAFACSNYTVQVWNVP